MTLARRLQINNHQVTTLHIYNRTVRRAFLISPSFLNDGECEDTHRKEWIRHRLKDLAKIFLIEVSAYAIMSNHYHLVVRTRPDLSRKLSPVETARRWWDLYPKKLDDSGNPKEPTDEDLDQILFDPKTGHPQGRFKLLQQRLSDISWFMKNLNEFISKRANREDNCTGTFWDGRFKSELLADQAAVLACMVYCDLNPIRADLAKTPESSDFTSGQDRFKAALTKQKLEGLRMAYQKQKKSKRDLENLEKFEKDLHRLTDEMSWLNSLVKAPYNQPYQGYGAMLNLDESEYLSVLDVTGRQLRRGKKGKIPDHLDPILERLDIKAENWLETVRHFDSWFYRFIGTIRSLSRAAQSRGLKWVAGIPGAKTAFKDG